MYKVEKYQDLTDFEAAVNVFESAGYELHSWQDCNGNEGWLIVAVFKRST